MEIPAPDKNKAKMEIYHTLEKTIRKLTLKVFDDNMAWGSALSIWIMIEK